VSDQRPPGPDDLPPTHRGYGDRSDENPFTSPSGPASEPSGPEYPAYQPEQPTYQQYSPQPQYGPPQPAYGYGYPMLPDHPQASTAFVLGLVSLIGGFFCGLPLLAGPFAWITGARARREIDQGQRYGGRDKATAGMVMGMVATGLLALGVLVIAFAVVVVAAAGA
jgi:hypothetical protein